MISRPKIAVIGGGTGSFTVLGGLKSLNCELTALVNMVDDGGSTGQLRDEYGVLPPGDVRQCLVALSDAPMPLRNLFNFRFPGDSALGGHSFGNLFLSAVEMMTDNFSAAVKMASEILNINGRVLPVTTEKCQLVMKFEGKEAIGQSVINTKRLPPGSRPVLSLRPKASLTKEAKQAINDADLIVISPGSLYGSILPTLLVEGMAESLRSAKAPLVYVCNLINKPNNTDFKVSDYAEEIEKIVGKDAIDYLLYNIDIPSAESLKKYARDKEYPVIIDEINLKRASYKAISGNFLSRKAAVLDKDDTLLERSLLRHNSQSVAAAILKIV